MIVSRKPLLRHAFLQKMDKLTHSVVILDHLLWIVKVKMKSNGERRSSRSAATYRDQAEEVQTSPFAWFRYGFAYSTGALSTLYALCSAPRFSITRSTEMSAGDTPEMRDA